MAASPRLLSPLAEDAENIAPCSPAALTSPSGTALYSPFKPFGASPRSIKKPPANAIYHYSPYRSSHPQPYRPSPLGNTAEPNIAPNNRSSTSFSAKAKWFTSSVLTKIAGATTSVYDDFVPEDAKAKPKEDPLKRVREGVASAAARPAKMVVSAAANVRDGAREAAKIQWGKELSHELNLGVSAIKSAVQKMDDEADAVFDKVEQGFTHLSRRISTMGGPRRQQKQRKAKGGAAGVEAAAADNTRAIQAAMMRVRNERFARMQAASTTAPPATNDDDAGIVLEFAPEAALTSLVESVQSGIEAAAESVANELNGMQQDISAVGDKVAYGLSEVGEAMEGKLVLAEESLIAVGGAVGGAVHQQLVEVGESFEGGASAMHEQLSLVGEALESSLPTSNEVLEKASGAVGKVGEAVHTVGVTVGGQIEAVEASLDEAVEEAVHTVNELVGSAADQLSNALPLLAEDVSAVAQSVRSTFAEPVQQQEEEKAQLTLDEEVERALEEDEVIVVEEKVKMD